MLRSILRSFGFGAVVFAVAGMLPAADWPQFLGPERNGVYSGDEFGGDWQKNPPKVLWRRPVGKGFAAPIIVSNRVVVFSREGDQAIVQALELRDAKPAWTFRYPTGYRDPYSRGDGPRSTPAAAGGRVFTFGAEGMLHCLDLGSGRELWKVDAAADFRLKPGFFGPACSPVVVGDRVVMTFGGKPGASVAAFDTATGRVAWQTSDDEASYASPLVADLGSGPVILALMRSGLLGLQPQDGKTLFSFAWRPPEHASVSAASPLVCGDAIFLSACYGAKAVVLKLRTAKPSVVWSESEALSNHYATSVHKDGLLFGYDGRQEEGCAFRCIQRDTGKVRWSKEGVGAGTVTLAGRHLLLLTEKGELVRAQPVADGYSETGRVQVLPFGVRAGPALAAGLLVARSEDSLVCVGFQGAH